MTVYISGSLANDRIMTFSGLFQDHFMADKLDHISVSFMVDRMEEKRGGCAGNIAYTLALLGEKPLILASVGQDFAPYAAEIAARGLPLDGIHRVDGLFTALCCIITDQHGNQITGFHPGAMSIPCGYSFPKLDPAADLALVGPGNIDDMRIFPAYYKKHGVRYIFDPGQQLPVLTKEDLLQAITGAFALASNDYELDMICKISGKTPAELQELTQWIITTKGEEGAVATSKGTSTSIAAVHPCELVDPTGAGDAFRAGLLKGLTAGLAVPAACRLGSVCSSFLLEKYGTQLHSFTLEQFRSRYEAVFGPLPICF